MSTGTLFDLGGGPAPALAPVPRTTRAPRGGQRKSAATHHESSRPDAAVHQGAPAQPKHPRALPPIDPDDTSFYAVGRRFLRMSRAELDAVDARHRAAGYCRPPSPDALAGAISACAPVPCAEPLVRCTCGAEMPARLLDECVARAADPSVWSLHRERLAGRVGAP